MLFYRSRPVFDFPLNWAAQPVKEFTFDLRSFRIGFGVDVDDPSRANVAHGFTVEFELQTPAEIAAYDTFLGLIRGRLQGFWIPSPHELCIPLAITLPTVFQAAGTGMVLTWNSQPCQTVGCYYGAAAPRISAIKDIILDGESSRVVLLEPVLSESWTPRDLVIRRLHYVRLAEDTEKISFIAEGWQKRKINVVELTEEYTRIESGEWPICLYHFWLEAGDTTRDWYLTSFGREITSGGIPYAAHAINHGSLQRSTKADREELNIDGVYDPASPLAMFIPFTLPAPLWVEVHEASYADPDTTTLLFTGRVDKVSARGRKLSASCSSMLDALELRIPRMIIGPRCNHALFNVATCKADPDDFELAVTIAPSTTGAVVTAAGLTGAVANYYAGGWIETGSGETWETRTILTSTAAVGTTVTLRLNSPLVHAVAGQAATIWPGCDRRVETCRDKFSNSDNFGGFPFVPINNLALKGIDTQPSAGGKK